MIISDLQKAKAESEKPTIDRAHREVWLEPTLDDLFDFEFKYLSNADLISFDIETPNEGISCIALAPDPYHAIVLPFEDIRKPMCCYWPTRAAEVQAWQWLKHILESDTPKLAQNGMFDIQHLALAGIFVRSFEHDTMLLHHALQPEEKKGLGVLGSLYLRDDEGAWKTMGGGAKKTTKRDN
jgi:DNA polymerase I-like protein with 3'-5' exonuclease and polymerase domains